MTLSSATSGQSHVADLPCQRWQLVGTVADPKGYKYEDTLLAGGTAKGVLWKSGKLKVLLHGKGASVLDYDLQIGVSQNPIDVAFTFGSGSQFCASCSSTGGYDGSNGKRFSAKDCAAPPSCN